MMASTLSLSLLSGPLWPHFIETKVYLVAQLWQVQQLNCNACNSGMTQISTVGVQVEVDEFERCACAVPVTRGYLIGVY